MAQGFLLWFTGLSGSGKTTISRAVEEALRERGRMTYRLDGDKVRTGLNADLGFSPEDRRENVRRLGEVGALMVDAGLIVLVAAISPYEEDRKRARSACPEGQFFEVYVSTPLEVCEGRDPKGLYERARAGTIPNFTGISAPYEAPQDAELSVVGQGDLAAVTEHVLSAIDHLL